MSVESCQLGCATLSSTCVLHCTESMKEPTSCVVVPLQNQCSAAYRPPVACLYTLAGGSAFKGINVFFWGRPYPGLTGNRSHMRMQKLNEKFLWFCCWMNLLKKQSTWKMRPELQSWEKTEVSLTEQRSENQVMPPFLTTKWGLQQWFGSHHPISSWIAVGIPQDSGSASMQADVEPKASARPNPHRTRDATRAQIRTFPFDVACLQCGHPHSHQQVPVACMALHVASRILCGLGLISGTLLFLFVCLWNYDQRDILCIPDNVPWFRSPCPRGPDSPSGFVTFSNSNMRHRKSIVSDGRVLIQVCSNLPVVRGGRMEDALADTGGPGEVDLARKIFFQSHVEFRQF